MFRVICLFHKTVLSVGGRVKVTAFTLALNTTKNGLRLI